MDEVIELNVAELAARLERLETEYNRVPLRGVLIGGGSTIQTVNVLPAIPAVIKTMVFLESVDAGQLPTIVPKPDARDTYWWAAPNDVRWHPIGGKFVDIVGDAGDMSPV